jgi:hypothetical protein
MQAVGSNLKLSNMKPIIKIFLICVLVGFVSCKKDTPYYKISDSMKQYFLYQKGSYWIYQNDSTNTIDSTYVDNISSGTQGIGDDGRHLYSFDWITINYKSKFLQNFKIAYFCTGPNSLQIAEIYSDLDSSLMNLSDGPTAFIGNSELNTLTYSNCLGNAVFIYKVIPSITVNDLNYSNIIYTKLKSIDSSSSNPEFYSREIYFAKNIGIIKYLETYRYFNKQRFWSLKTYKVIQ